MFSIGIFKSNWKRFWIVPIVAAIILFLGITFPMMMEVQDVKEQEKNNPYINNVIIPQTIADTEIIVEQNDIVNRVEPSEGLEVTTPIEVIETEETTVINPNQARYFIRILYNFLNIATIFVLPVVISILIFNYKNGEKSSSFIHGLGISKKKLYFTNTITGMLMYVLPYVVNLIIIFILQAGDMGDYLQAIEIWKWFGLSMLYQSVFYSFACFIGMLCASKISHGLLTYIFMYIPAGIIVFLSRILEEILFGFNGFSSQIEEFILKIPFIKVIENFGEMSNYYSNTVINIDIKDIVIYIGVSILMLVIGYFLYKKEKLEITKEFISFKAIGSIVKYIGTFGVNLLSYAYFYSIFDENEVTSIVASLIVTLIAYIIIEMILKKSYKVLKSIKGFAVYAITIVIAYIIVINGALGFETRVPNLENVKEASITRFSEEVTFDEKANIETILKLHKQIVKDKEEGYSTYYIEYTLKNGQKMSRKYDIPSNKEIYNKELKSLFNSKEFIEESIKPLQDIEKIEDIRITIYERRNNYNYNSRQIKIKENQKEEFMQYLIQDIKNKKAKINGSFSSGIVTIKEKDINELAVSINFKDGKYKSISYYTLEEIKIKDYFYILGNYT